MAKGLETQGIDGPMPKAADMYELVWDEGLAASAQRWNSFFILLQTKQKIIAFCTINEVF